MNVDAFQTLTRWRRTAWVTGAIGLAICLITVFFARTRTFQAYWMAWIFWSGISLGGLLILLLHALSGGAWGKAVRPPAEAAAMTLPLMAFIFVPALFGLGDIFPWMHPAAFAGHDWPHKRAFLTAPSFIVRSLLYLIVLVCLHGTSRPMVAACRLAGAPSVSARKPCAHQLRWASSPSALR